MKNIVIKGNWRWFFILTFVLSIGFNITLVKACFYFVSMPVPDKEVTEAFKMASPEVAAPRTFSYRFGNRYYLLLETTKEVKEKLEELQNKSS